MAPLDPDQRVEVAEMIRTGTNDSFAASAWAWAEIKVSMQKGHDDISVTTEAEIQTQRAHNFEVEKKYVEFTQNIAAQFAALRAELGTEFDASKKDAAEIHTLITGF